MLNVRKTFKLGSGLRLENVIEVVENIMIAEKLNLIVVQLLGKLDHDAVVYAGFVPYDFISPEMKSENDTLVAHYVEKLTIEEQDLWSPGDTILDLLRNENIDYEYNRWFIYGNLEGWKDLTVKRALSFPLLLYFPDQLYASNRPITQMAQYRQATSATYDPKVTIRNEGSLIHEVLLTVPIDGQSTMLGVPITRYGDGMSKGLYYDSYDEKLHCGTFYYYEPESTTYLVAKTFRVYRNKYEAMKELYAQFNLKADLDNPRHQLDNENVALNRRNFEIFKRYFKDRQSLPADMKMTFNEYTDPYAGDEGLPDYDDAIARLPQRRRYIGVLVGLYAAEDKYDQPLCKIARENGIEIIILTDMIGSHQIVIEVLDTRSRQISFSNLVYPSRNKA